MIIRAGTNPQTRTKADTSTVGPTVRSSFTSLLICLTISGHFTHTQSTYNHKKWKLIKHNKSRFNHIFTFANTLTNTQSTAW